MNRSVWVPSHWTPTYDEQDVEVPTGRTRFLRGQETRVEHRRVPAGESDSIVDGRRLRDDIQAAIDQLNADGYRVVTITPVQSGAHDSEYYMQGAAGYGFGYTQGVIIIGESTT